MRMVFPGSVTGYGEGGSSSDVAGNSCTITVSWQKSSMLSVCGRSYSGRRSTFSPMRFASTKGSCSRQFVAAFGQKARKSSSAPSSISSLRRMGIM